MKALFLRFRELLRPADGGGVPRAFWAYAIAALAAFFAFQQMDLHQTAPQGYLLLDSILKGRFLSFYSDAQAAFCTPAYNICVYLVFAVWLLPLFLAGVLLGIAMPSFVTVFYGKLLLAGFACVGAVKLAEVAGECGENEDGERGIFREFLTSPFVFFLIFCFGGYDIFSLTFTLCAVSALLKKQLWRFTLWIGFAACFKNFALLPFLPLLLLHEKRLLRLTGHAGLVLLFQAVTRIPFLADATLAERGSFESGFLARLFCETFPSGVYPAGFFCTGMVLLCLIAYGMSQTEEAARKKWIVYFPLLTFGLLFLTIPWHSQWLILIVPYLLLARRTSGADAKKFAILEILLFVSYCGILAIGNVNGVDHRLLRDGLPGIFFATKFDSQALEMRDLCGGGGAALTICFVAFRCILAYLIYFVRPGQKPACAGESLPCEVRCGAVLLFAVPALFCFTASLVLEKQVLSRLPAAPRFLGWSIGDEDSGGARPLCGDLFARAKSPFLYPDMENASRARTPEITRDTPFSLPFDFGIGCAARGIALRFSSVPAHVVKGELRDEAGFVLWRFALSPGQFRSNGYAAEFFPEKRAIPARGTLILTSDAGAGEGVSCLAFVYGGDRGRALPDMRLLL